jgi:cbb3-type cytochrome oxidase subunit 3
MKLSDVMSAMNLASYAEAALVIFLLVFAAVAIDVFRRGRRDEAIARLPLEDDCATNGASEPRGGAQ